MTQATNKTDEQTVVVAETDKVAGKANQLTDEQRAQLSRSSMYQFLTAVDQASSSLPEDNMMRREKFAVSLRNKKREMILGSKRKKTLANINRSLPTSS